MARISQKDEAELLLLEYQLTRQLIIQEGDQSLAQFIRATDDKFEWNWHHFRICEKLDRVVSGELKRLIITMPPRHGKSEIVSRKFPAYFFGKRPDDFTILVSYADSLASKFNRATQKIMKSPEYRAIFPTSYLNQVNPDTGIRPRLTNKDFELPLTRGTYRSAGYMSGVTGEGANLLIIDDPIKNRAEAESEAYREALWDEYKNTLLTRLQPDGAIIICLTRWHEGDLVGQLLEKMADEGDEYADQWEVLSLEAIKETDHDYDPRELGEALWPDWFPIHALKKIESAMGHDFSALYQQSPSLLVGNIVEKDWFRFYDKTITPLGIPDFWVDTADKAKKHNDRTAILGGVKFGNSLYLTHGATIRAKFPQRVDFLIQTVNDHGNPRVSMIKIEPKSSGQSIIDYMQEDTDLNVMEGTNPTEKKEIRLTAVSPRIRAGRVYLPLNEAWVVEFVKEVCGFPKRPFDDYVDCLIEAIQDTLGGYTLDMTTANYGDN